VSPFEFVPLTHSLLQAIDHAYDKSRQSDAYKVHKVLLNKLDDLTTDLRAVSSTETADGASHLSLDLCAPTVELETLIKAVISAGKEGAPSVRLLWTGRTSQLERKRKERVLSDGEVEAEDTQRRDKRDRGPDPKSTDEESDTVNGLPWSGRVQKRIEAWAGYVFSNYVKGLSLICIQSAQKAAECRSFIEG
jgi:hypothetical protein